MPFRYNLAAVLSVLALTGCGYVNYPEYECGRIWGSDRGVVKEDAFDKKYLTAARRGYIYAIAGTLVLQKDDKDSNDHYFANVNRLRKVENLTVHDKDTGFEAVTFELMKLDKPTVLGEVVVSFAGSNDGNDWIQNFSLWNKEQYNQATQYVKDVKAIPKYRNIPLKVVGFSLGGALAVHVTRNLKPIDLVAETWAFNPSPKTYSDGIEDPRIWLLAHRGEALSIFREPLFRFLPGFTAIGAPNEQTADDFYLIDTNLIYGHFRWVLPMQLLHVADFAILKDENRTSGPTEPSEILQQTRFKGAKPCH